MQEISFIQNIDNVAKLLDKISAEKGIERGELSAEIRKVKSYVKAQGSEAFEFVEDISDEIFEDNSASIKQSYDVAIFHTKNERKFHIEVLHNGESIDLICKAGFEIPKNMTEFETLAFAIIALKAEQGIILRNLDKGKNVLYKHLKNLDSPLKSEFRFCILKSKNFVDSKDGKIDFFISGIDLAKKNIIALKENVKICTYTLPKIGNAGRNLRGEIITPEAKTAFAPSCSDEIKKSELDGFYEYTSNKNGFVIFEGNHFSFNNEISLQNAELRDNYNFLGDLETQSKIIVSTSDEFNDALKSGMKLRANHISVSGNLAENTTLEANEIEINGQTHKSTAIFCKNAKISTHRGILNCESAKISAFEGGIVRCESVEIVQANGGEIEANTISINELFSGANVKFSAKLVVNSLKGGDNKIIFTPLAGHNKQKIESLLKELNSNQISEQNLKKKETALVYQYNKFHQTARELKAQIADDKAKKRATPDYVLKNYKAFLEIVNDLKTIKSKIATLNKEHTIIINTIREYQQSVFSAEFLCKDGWLKYNDVIFELISPKVHQQKTIIKGVGKYQFSAQEKCIIHHKIFNSENDETINNQGF